MVSSSSAKCGVEDPAKGRGELSKLMGIPPLAGCIRKALITVIASEAKQSRFYKNQWVRDCFAARTGSSQGHSRYFSTGSIVRSHITRLKRRFEMTKMEKIKDEHFECIKEDNSEEEYEKQWKRSKIIFDHFYESLKNEGLKENTAGKRTDMAAYFIMNYVFVYEDLMNILEVSGDTIRKFLGNWYIRKFMSPKMSQIKSFLRSISDFFTFLRDEGFITDEDSNEIKAVCKDTAWFEMRLKTYFEAQGGDFYEWIQEYNYDW
jgi:hypothetical protein